MDSRTSWFYIGVVAFAAGIFARSFIAFGLPEISWLLVIAFCVALSGRKLGFAQFAPTFLLSLVLFCFAQGALRLELASWQETVPTLENSVGKQVSLQGVVVRDPEERANSVHLYVKTEHGLILVTTEKGEKWQYGDLVSVEGNLKRPEPFLTDLGRPFNYRGYLLARGVSYMVGYADVTKEAADPRQCLGRPLTPLETQLHAPDRKAVARTVRRIG